MRKLFLILWSLAALAGAASVALLAPERSGGLYANLSRSV
jgi:hypothetical protein